MCFCDFSAFSFKKVSYILKYVMRISYFQILNCTLNLEFEVVDLVCGTYNFGGEKLSSPFFLD